MASAWRMRCALLPLFLICAVAAYARQTNASWRATLLDTAGHPLDSASVTLKLGDSSQDGNAAAGVVEFHNLPPGQYIVTITTAGRIYTIPTPITMGAGATRSDTLRLQSDGSFVVANNAQATGGERLSSNQVTALPLNKRDFSALLLLATGTQTDTNGAANFTQQFTVNGQRGIATVFAMDGADSTDPELGGATFSNLNVDAIQEIHSSSGVLPADIGHGAAGFTEIVTKSGTNDIHGSIFEFVRNAAFDARNFFDRQSIAQPERLPPFERNEFGFVVGGPLVLPGYDGRNRTYFFGEYQGFRQVLGTTQVLPVPTAQERLGIDTTAFPGDTLYVPVDPRIAPILNHYPLPNDPEGPFGARTYATSSKVVTTSDQFSVRIDQQFSEKARLFGRFSLNDVNGPLTNPSQTAIDPSFALTFLDRQRNAVLNYTANPTASLISESSFGWIRSTPLFDGQNHTQPGISFGDGLYEPFNSAAGSLYGAYGSLFQARQNFTKTHGNHTWRAGFEGRFNVDTTIFGVSTNGLYVFGGGAAYSPVAIRSLSGAHDISVGQALPDSLTGLLTATPFQYSIAVAPPQFPQGDHIDEAAVRRQAYNFFVMDTWKATPRFTVTYGLRYELNSRIKEANHLTSGVYFNSNGGLPDFLINPQPHYPLDTKGWGPRLAIDWQINPKTIFHAGGSIVTLLPNLWQENFITGGLPFTVTPLVTAAPGAPILYSNTVQSISTPAIYSTNGQLIYPPGRATTAVPPNTPFDLLRFEADLAALSSDKQIHTLQVQGVSQNFANGYVPTWSAGLERQLGDINLSAAYVGTAGGHLGRIDSPNGYAGASPQYAPYTLFNSAGQVTGGYGPIAIIATDSHSTYHSLQASATKTSLRYGLGFQASYTFSKSLDDTSAILGGGFSPVSGTIIQAAAQDPFDIRAEKAPSTFDIRQAVSINAVKDFSLAAIPFIGSFSPRFTKGWHLLGVATFLSGSPFTVYSGIQQTGVGSGGGDRPDQIDTPVFSTSRTVREDYFGLGANNSSYFSIPIDLPGGTGPNSGYAGTLGRNTFRGPDFHQIDLSLLKDTPIGGASNPERVLLQFRAEAFNTFNIVNFGLPGNILLGPGFGVIAKTAGPSRQIQLSLKVLF